MCKIVQNFSGSIDDARYSNIFFFPGSQPTYTHVHTHAEDKTGLDWIVCFFNGCAIPNGWLAKNLFWTFTMQKDGRSEIKNFKFFANYLRSLRLDLVSGLLSVCLPYIVK